MNIRRTISWSLYYLIGRAIVSATGFAQSTSLLGTPPPDRMMERHRMLRSIPRGGAAPTVSFSEPTNAIKSVVSQIGSAYAQSLSKRPIITKSITAGLIFALSDYIAQRSSSSKATDRTRLAVSAAVGLFYFGPAAHYWYNWMFRLFPETNLPSTLSKAAMGQTLFGPTFTCIFFATGLWQAGQLTWKNYSTKIRRDLPKTWITGAGFWITVDLISYSYLPVPYIPLFVNVASLIWTTYLVLKAYSGNAADGRKAS